MAFISRVVHLEGNSGGSTEGTIGHPTGKLVGVYYQFDLPGQSANLAVHNAGRDLFTKTGAAGTDPLEAVADPDLTTQHPVIHGHTRVAATASLNAGEGVDVVLIIEV